MKKSPDLSRLRAASILALLLSAAFLTSCKSMQKNDGVQYATNGEYATTPSDGHYNPYPGGSTPAATSSTQSQYQQYTEAPPPPSQPKKSTTSASSSSTKKKSSTGSTTASSSSSKKKSSSGSTTASTSKKKSPGSSTSSKSTSTASGSTYVVKQSDTLYGISHKFHVTVSKLKSVNNLTSDIIRPGMKIKIP